ncbi:MAG: hypothetical protein GY898_28905 [Proteobacteria bacterium]|nr:hypothetical protein [Pseudomonadota bacterium]
MTPPGEGAFPAFARDRLSGFERISVRACDAINTSRSMKAFLQFFVRNISARWVRAAALRRIFIHGREHLPAIDGEHGVVLVANHRSFFDMYVASGMLYRDSSFMQRLYFPVRSRFFYTSPVGLFVNLVISGCAMWPPVFQDRRRDLASQSLEQAAWALNRAGSVLGYHPEGTRGKGPDPYAFGPAKKGIGRLLRACHPETRVLPFFLIGMGSRFVHEVFVLSWRGHRGDNQHKIRLWFSEGLRVGDVVEGRTDQEIADYLMDLVGELGAQDTEEYGAWTPR